MNILKLSTALLVAAVLSGCAHPVMIAPALAKLERRADAKPKIKANVGYVLNDAQRSQTFETLGGGGDKVTSTPYRDLETGFYKMLTNVFNNVAILKKADDQDAIRTNQLSYLITPRVVPTSSSSSVLTWPPTDFSVDLTCDISDANGKLIDTKRVVGKGHAEFSEFKSDFGMSGKRAMEDALLQMQKVLLDMPQTGPVVTAK